MSFSHSPSEVDCDEVGASIFFRLVIFWYVGVPEIVERLLKGTRARMSLWVTSTTMVVDVT